MVVEETTQINPVEIEASQVKAELDAVWNSQITAENISNFSDDCLDKVIGIVKKVSLKYFPGEEITATSEDLAMEEMGLEVSTTLDNLKMALEQKRQQIDEIFEFVTKAEVSEIVLVPPGEGNISRSDGESENQDFTRKQIPRIETIIYILVHDLNIPKEEIKILKGIVSINIFRKSPYVRIEANGKIIYACNEHKNASYIFSKSKLPEGIDIAILDGMSKEQFIEIINMSPKDHYVVGYFHNWRDVITKILSGNVENKKRDLDPGVLIPISDRSNPDFGYAILNGEKWGIALTIQSKERINQGRFEKMSVGLETKPMLIRGKIRAGYRVSDILERDKKRDVPIAEKTGEWKGYVTVGDIHYGTVLSLSKKLEVSRGYLEKLFSKFNFPSILINTGDVVKAYSYEDALEALRNNPPQKMIHGNAKNN